MTNFFKKKGVATSGIQMSDVSVFILSTVDWVGTKSGASLSKTGSTRYISFCLSIDMRLKTFITS